MVKLKYAVVEEVEKHWRVFEGLKTQAFQEIGWFVRYEGIEWKNGKKSKKEEECTFEGDSTKFEAGILNGTAGVSSMIPN